MADPHGIHKAPSDFLDPWLVDRALPVPPPEGSPQASLPGKLPVGPLRAASPFESDWGFRRCGLVFAAPGPPTAVHLPSPPPLPPSPHALPMRFPGKVPGEGLEKPRPSRGSAPVWPGGWSAGGQTPGNAEVLSGRIPWAYLVRPRGEDPRGKPGMSLGRSRGKAPEDAEGDPVGKPRGHRGRPRGKAPGSTWGDGGSGGAGGCPTPRAGRFARETPQTG